MQIATSQMIKAIKRQRTRSSNRLSNMSGIKRNLPESALVSLPNNIMIRMCLTSSYYFQRRYLFLPGHCPDDNPEKREMIPEGVRTGSGGAHVVTDEGGLIVPRKPANPVREDPGRQNLHKELLFNQKMCVCCCYSLNNNNNNNNSFVFQW